MAVAQAPMPTVFAAGVLVRGIVGRVARLGARAVGIRMEGVPLREEVDGVFDGTRHAGHEAGEEQHHEERGTHERILRRTSRKGKAE